VLHGTEVNLPNYILRLLTHQAIAVADVIVPVSEFTKSLLPARILDKHRNIVIIKNGIDDVWSNQRAGIKIDLAGYPRLLTVGHVSPRKGQHRVIKALPLLVSRFPQIHYHIVGLPLNQNKLEQLAEELGVRQHITFHGRVSHHTDLRDYYVSADIFMLLSENQPDGDVEGFGIVALEANLHGLPVVGARYCGVEEAVSHKNSGYLVDGNEAEEILEGITYCLNHKDELDQNSRDWAKRHQWDEIVKQYLEVLY
jgi:phosphatidylinositol alpha-1,6-mannosyltransferase